MKVSARVHTISKAHARTPVSQKQWDSVQALVGTRISESTYMLLYMRGWYVSTDMLEGGAPPYLLKSAHHPAGVAS